MKQKLTFWLNSGYDHPSSGLPGQENFPRKGITRYYWWREKLLSVEIRLSIEKLQPLLRKDLTDAER
jgi:hypothetical protein